VWTRHRGAIRDNASYLLSICDQLWPRRSEAKQEYWNPEGENLVGKNPM